MKIRFCAAALAALVIGTALSQQPQPSPEAQKKQQEFRQKTMSSLTPEEREHLQANGKVNREEWMAAHPSRESTGLVPLPELGTGMYKGEQGGLYPGGVNTAPA